MSDDNDSGGSPWRRIVGLVLIVALVAAVLFVVQQLRQASQIQDCVASGRTNCAPVSTDR